MSLARFGESMVGLQVVWKIVISPNIIMVSTWSKIP
jgi:hypothetical protein